MRNYVVRKCLPNARELEFLMLELDLPPHETITFKHYSVVIQREKYTYKKSEGIGLVKKSQTLRIYSIYTFFIVNLCFKFAFMAFVFHVVTAC